MKNEKQPIIIGCDHAGYLLKEKVKVFLIENGFDVEDAGVYNQNSVDYTDIAVKVASLIAKEKFEKGILICGTGIGMSMAANRFKKIRAAICNDMFSAIMSRRHNNSNVLALGARIIGDGLAEEIVKLWLETPFEGGRHICRIEKMDTCS
ncbi:MAG: ribose 5-phosphate isomerase B [Desulfobacterales bacterium]|nr:ribose 5-phosphate isomerase B [Desulfobacterales bacterium]